MKKDLILEGALYAKCYRGHIDAFPYLLKLHIARIAAELREVDMVIAWEEMEAEYNRDPWMCYRMHIFDEPGMANRPFITNMSIKLNVSNRVAFRIRNEIDMRQGYWP